MSNTKSNICSSNALIGNCLLNLEYSLVNILNSEPSITSSLGLFWLISDIIKSLLIFNIDSSNSLKSVIILFSLAELNLVNKDEAFTILNIFWWIHVFLYNSANENKIITD